MKPTDFKLLFMCPHYYGIGDTLHEARAACKRAGATNTDMKKHVLYIIHPASTIEPIFGGIQYPKGYPPKRIHWVGVKPTPDGLEY